MSESNIWKGLEDHNLDGYTLVVPSVAVGNIGQLACDLLISSFNMKKLASVYSPALIPILGYDPYNLHSNSLSSCCEVYKSEEKNLVVLQLRAPLVYKYARSFLQEVVKKFKERSIKDVIVLSSSYAHEKKHIQSSPFRYVANESSPYKNKITSLGLVEHTSSESQLRIYGGGFASLLYKITEEDAVPCLVLYKFCSEGDNIPDAYDMVSLLASVLPLFKSETDLSSQLVQPVSWKLLFGRPPPQDIY